MSKTETVKKTIEGLSPLQQEVLNRADAIVGSIRDSISKAGEFLMEHLPSLAQEYIAYGRASATAYTLLGLALLMYAGLNFWLNRKRFEELDHEFKSRNEAMNFRAFIFVVSLPISTIVGFIVFFSNLGDFIKVWFAPRIWLLENIVDLVKKMT